MVKWFGFLSVTRTYRHLALHFTAEYSSSFLCGHCVFGGGHKPINFTRLMPITFNWAFPLRRQAAQQCQSRLGVIQSSAPHTLSRKQSQWSFSGELYRRIHFECSLKMTLLHAILLTVALLTQSVPYSLALYLARTAVKHSNYIEGKVSLKGITVLVSFPTPHLNASNAHCFFLSIAGSAFCLSRIWSLPRLLRRCDQWDI